MRKYPPLCAQSSVCWAAVTRAPNRNFCARIDASHIVNIAVVRSSGLDGSDRCGRPARSPAAPLRPSRDGFGWASRLSAGAVDVWEWLPVHLQVLAPPEPFEVPVDEILDPLQAFLAGGFGAHRQRARACLHGAPAPAHVEGPVGVGPFDLLDLRAHLRPACVAQGFVVDAAGVPAELDEVPARLAGLDACFGGRHGSSLWRGRRARPAGCGLWGRGATSSTGRGPRRERAAAASG